MLEMPESEERLGAGHECRKKDPEPDATARETARAWEAMLQREIASFKQKFNEF